MKALRKLIKWDLILQARYQILTALTGVTLIYLLLFWLVPATRNDELLILIIFSDPALLGLTFIGALILFEKGDHTLDALVVTPIRDWQYIWAKAISLSLSATAVSILLAGIGHGWDFNYVLFIGSMILTSLLYILLGFVLVSRAKSMNEYIIKVALATLPIGLPLLNLFGITHSWLMYLIPSQASLRLFQASFGVEMAFWEIMYGFAYLLIAVGICYELSLRAYHRHIIGS